MGLGEWLGIIGVGLALLALPTVFQMIWGRPRIEFEFEERTEDGKKVLACRIFNRAVKNPVLKFLKVRREVAHISAAYTVHNDATGNRIVSLTQPIFVTQRGHSKEIELAPTITGALVGIVFANDQGVFAAEAAHGQSGDQPATLLPPGTYSVPLVVFCGEEPFSISRSFVVTQRPLDSYWAD
jgi:hypothetical protein